jgi:uncharacterized protein (TIGR02270 family)
VRNSFQPGEQSGNQIPTRKIVPIVVRQHAEDAAVLHATRSALVGAPHVKLLHLRRFDDRLAAHLDGLSVAGEDGWRFLQAALETPSSGAMFAATVRAIEDRNPERLNRLSMLSQSAPEAQSGMRSAFGWLEPPVLRGVVAQLLASDDPALRAIGVAASAMHRVDPGLIAARRLEDADPRVRARAFRTAGELGRRELVSMLAAAINDEDETCQCWAAWSAVLLGDRQSALDFLSATAMTEGPFKQRAFRLALLASPLARSQALLRQFKHDPANVRDLIQGAGLAGDPAYIPWLIGHMADDKLARLAGEAFSMITGLDLAWLDLERKPPENFESGPNDDPEDPNVALDEDEGLPWPDQALIQRWWDQHGARFAKGTRHFMGAPLEREHCVEVLREGFQRQRIAAAHHLCLLRPGEPLFEWRAPAWRQQREVARLT